MAKDEQQVAERVSRKLTGQAIPAVVLRAKYGAALLITNPKDAAELIGIIMRGQFCNIDGYGNDRTFKVGPKVEAWEVEFIDERRVTVMEDEA